MNFDFSSEKQKESLLHTLIEISASDGSIADGEFVYILQVGLSLGFNEKEIRRIWSAPRKALLIPKNENERMTILCYIIFLVKTDNKVNSDEENLIHYYGLKLGFSPLMISDFIKVIKKNLNTKLSPEWLVQELKKYLN